MSSAAFNAHRASARYSACRQARSGSWPPRKSRRHPDPTCRSSPLSTCTTTNVAFRRRRSPQCSHQAVPNVSGSSLAPSSLTARTFAAPFRCSTIAASAHPASTGAVPCKTANAKPALSRSPVSQSRIGAVPSFSARRSSASIRRRKGPSVSLGMRNTRPPSAACASLTRSTGIPSLAGLGLCHLAVASSARCAPHTRRASGLRMSSPPSGRPPPSLVVRALTCPPRPCSGRSRCVSARPAIRSMPAADSRAPAPE